MEKTIEEKLKNFRKFAKQSVNQTPRTFTPATPDSLSTVIRTKEDATSFMAQLDALTELARKEYRESKKSN